MSDNVKQILATFSLSIIVTAAMTVSVYLEGSRRRDQVAQLQQQIDELKQHQQLEAKPR